MKNRRVKAQAQGAGEVHKALKFFLKEFKRKLAKVDFLFFILETYLKPCL